MRALKDQSFTAEMVPLCRQISTAFEERTVSSFGLDMVVNIQLWCEIYCERICSGGLAFEARRRTSTTCPCRSESNFGVPYP